MNTGDLPAARMKAGITRRTRKTVRTSPIIRTARGGTGAIPPLSPGTTQMSEPVTQPPKARAYKGKQKFMGSFKKGGFVKRTGVYLVHKGEAVIPAHVVSGLSK